MSQRPKQKVAVIIGAGFSAGLTTGVSPPIGNHPMPTLFELPSAILAHMTEVRKAHQNEESFSSETLEVVLSILKKNESLPENARYDFEQLISLLSIKSFFSSFSSSYKLPRINHQHLFEDDYDVLRCLI